MVGQPALVARVLQPIGSLSKCVLARILLALKVNISIQILVNQIGFEGGSLLIGVL